MPLLGTAAELNVFARLRADYGPNLVGKLATIASRSIDGRLHDTDSADAAILRGALLRIGVTDDEAVNRSLRLLGLPEIR